MMMINPKRPTKCSGDTRQPRGRGPGPPERAEQQHPPEEATPRRAARQEARDLRDREDHHEVEEELERRDPVTALGLSIVLSIVHPHPGHYPCGTNLIVAVRASGPTGWSTILAAWSIRWSGRRASNTPPPPWH